MIKQLVKEFEKWDKYIDALSIFILFCFCLLLARIIFFPYEEKPSGFWAVLTPLIAMASALLVAFAGKRQIAHVNLIREDDRRQDVVRVTHHLLAIANDLNAHVAYVNTLLIKGDSPVFLLLELATTIERRYETLLERDAYKYLPGTVVDLICQMSGSIFGIRMLSYGLEKATTDQQIISINSVMPNREAPVNSVNHLLNEITKLIDHIHKLRATLDLATD